MNKYVVCFLLLLNLAGIQLAHAQQPNKLRRIGLLLPFAPPPASSPTPLDQGLRQMGYVEGQNIGIERRYANG